MDVCECLLAACFLAILLLFYFIFIWRFFCHFVALCVTFQRAASVAAAWPTKSAFTSLFICKICKFTIYNMNEEVAGGSGRGKGKEKGMGQEQQRQWQIRLVLSFMQSTAYCFPGGACVRLDLQVR